ncbi:hypothetical protein [Aquibacillus kalidii]|uniref:hypothetical protein n=1 Tax=Aquibacillus kalidii TaxID=2762597 RepID=UPI001647A5C6|nr:hypothetical protein [Aquibacillus kalidii]
MKTTKFDCNLWGLTSFDQVSYDKHNHLFVIYLFDGSQLQFSEVDESIVFKFILSEQKEAFLSNTLLKNYPYIQLKNWVSNFT